MQLPRSSLRRRPLLALIVLIVILLVGYAVKGLRTQDPSSTTPPAQSTSATAHTAMSGLPEEAARTVELIRHGGPFPYRQDGVIYGNLERRLPIKPRGYYHEYTVATPGSPDRGARRIVTGRDGQFFYTGNHYGSFTQIDVRR